MKKERKDKDFIKAPYIEGGKHALEQFVKNELRYPAEALEAKTEGTVSVRYSVDYKGHIQDAHIISGIGHGCDEEALRLVRKLQFKVPNEGKIKSKFTRKIHIHFRLPGSPATLPTTKKIPVAPSATPLDFQYQVTPTKSPGLPKPVANSTSNSYQYTITLPDKENK